MIAELNTLKAGSFSRLIEVAIVTPSPGAILDMLNERAWGVSAIANCTADVRFYWERPQGTWRVITGAAVDRKVKELYQI